MLFAACTSTPSQQPTSLHVTRVGTMERTNVSPRSWVITDTYAVQQLFNEIQNLPTHHNNGADSCAMSYYTYHLNFFAGTKSIAKDDLYAYCSTLSSSPGGTDEKLYDPTQSFNSLFAKMLQVSPNNLSGRPTP